MVKIHGSLHGYLGTAFVTGIQGGCVQSMFFVIIFIKSDHPHYIKANTGYKHFDVHGGPENITVSRSSFDAKV